MDIPESLGRFVANYPHSRTLSNSGTGNTYMHDTCILEVGTSRTKHRYNLRYSRRTSGTEYSEVLHSR